MVLALNGEQVLVKGLCRIRLVSVFLEGNLFLCVNLFWIGTTEAFLHAVVTKGQLARSNIWLLICSLIYVSLSITLIHQAGAVGLIIANCISILLLISKLHNLFFVAQKNRAHYIPI